MTYADVWPINGRELKRDLDNFRRMVQKKLGKVSYLWIAELQTRGCPHFHFFSDIAVTPENHTILGNIWHTIAGYNNKSHLLFHIHTNNFIKWSMGNAGYLTKYLDKESQKSIPQGFSSFGRFWGNSQDIKPRVQDYITADELKLFHVGDEKPMTYLVRNLGRYQEKINRRSTIRTTPQSRTVLTGAAVANRLREYLITAPAGWDIPDPRPGGPEPF